MKSPLKLKEELIFKNKVKILIFILLLSTAAYLFTWIPRSMIKYPGLLSSQTIMNISISRFKYMLVIFTSVTLIATSSLVFQTVTQSKILTPSVLGFDSLFVTVQTLIVLFLGVDNIFFTNSYFNFVLSSTTMSVISILLLRMSLKKGSSNVYFLLMIGMIFGVFLNNLNSFFQVMMSPANFDAVQASSAASIKSVNLNLFFIALPLFIVLILYFLKYSKVLDVVSLGRENAMNLGVDYSRMLNKLLILISFSVALSTALIGPFAFLGLLSVNLAREFAKTYKHKELILVSSIIGSIFVLTGQVLVDEFVLIPNLQSISNLIGGIYIIRIIIKETK